MKHTSTHKGTVKSFICDVCGQHKRNDSGFTTGYGTNSQGQIVCYACCAIQDKQYMLDNGKITLYLTTNKDTGCYNVTNWPGSLAFPVRQRSVGKHNIAGKRYDVWFIFNSYWWWGIQYGDNTQLCHCKKTKQPA